MARFERTRPVPAPSKKASDGYSHNRPYVRADFEERCAYCLIHEVLRGGLENFEIDHFKPRARFPDELGNFYNLYYSCHPCNFVKRDQWPPGDLIEGGIFFVDLFVDEAESHFSRDSDGRLLGITAAGSYTIEKLRLNRPQLIELRNLLWTFHKLQWPYRRTRAIRAALVWV